MDGNRLLCRPSLYRTHERVAAGGGISSFRLPGSTPRRASWLDTVSGTAAMECHGFWGWQRRWVLTPGGPSGLNGRTPGGPPEVLPRSPLPPWPGTWLVLGDLE